MPVVLITTRTCPSAWTHTVSSFANTENVSVPGNTTFASQMDVDDASWIADQDLDEARETNLDSATNQLYDDMSLIRNEVEQEARVLNDMANGTEDDNVTYYSHSPSTASKPAKKPRSDPSVTGESVAGGASVAAKSVVTMRSVTTETSKLSNKTGMVYTVPNEASSKRPPEVTDGLNQKPAAKKSPPPNQVTSPSNSASTGTTFNTTVSSLRQAAAAGKKAANGVATGGPKRSRRACSRKKALAPVGSPVVTRGRKKKEEEEEATDNVSVMSSSFSGMTITSFN